MESSNILQTLRKPRIGGFVIFDTIASLIGAVIISKTLDFNIFITIIVLLILSIILHVVFNISTHTNFLLNLSPEPIY